MKFIADSMLGRLARWLRLLGYDTLYYPHIENGALLRIAREEERVLLTRDTRLVKVRGLRSFLLLEANDPFEQLKKVIAVFGLDVADKTGDTGTSETSGRCIVCNSGLGDVPREDVRGFVPEYVYRTSNIFRRCSGCGKFYWDGTHPVKFKKKLQELLCG